MIQKLTSMQGTWYSIKIRTPIKVLIRKLEFRNDEFRIILKLVWFHLLNKLHGYPLDRIILISINPPDISAVGIPSKCVYLSNNKLSIQLECTCDRTRQHTADKKCSSVGRAIDRGYVGMLCLQSQLSSSNISNNCRP